MSYVPLKQPLLEDDGSYEYEETLLAERNEQARHLADDIYHLKGAMDDLRGLVQEQGAMLEIADDNIMKADMDVEVSVQELEKAYIYKTRSRRRIWIIIILVLIVIGISVGVVLKLVLKK